jgi:hypothetical protein
VVVLPEEIVADLGLRLGSPVYVLPNRQFGRYELLTAEDVARLEKEAEAASE